MVFDFPTLVAVIVFTSALVGCLLLFSWLQHRRIFALALWGSAFIIAAIATVLVVIVRSLPVPDLWSIVIGNVRFSPRLMDLSGAGHVTSTASGFQSFFDSGGGC